MGGHLAIGTLEELEEYAEIREWKNRKENSKVTEDAGGCLTVFMTFFVVLLLNLLIVEAI